MPFKYFAIFWALTLILPWSTSIAQDEKLSDKSAAFLYAYTPKDGQTETFNNGYKEHLQWHKENGDKLPWFGWYVLFGDNIGQFIDGTFGISFEDFDNRVKPQEDGQHFAKTAGSFATPNYRKIYKVRRDLSKATPLENKTPSQLLQVSYFIINPGFKTNFVNIIKEINIKQEQGIQQTWYELKAGGDETTFMLMTSFGSIEEIGAAKNFKETIETRYQNGIAPILKSVKSEIWLYRADLSLLPEIKSLEP